MRPRYYGEVCPARLLLHFVLDGLPKALAGSLGIAASANLDPERSRRALTRSLIGPGDESVEGHSRVAASSS